MKIWHQLQWHPTTVFRKISVRRNNGYREISTLWKPLPLTCWVHLYYLYGLCMIVSTYHLRSFSRHHWPLPMKAMASDSQFHHSSFCSYVAHCSDMTWIWIKRRVTSSSGMNHNEDLAFFMFTTDTGLFYGSNSEVNVFLTDNWCLYCC